jgi:glycosyltransferase involved in cell wall biosynthesis
MSEGQSGRIPILYLAPWVGYGGSDKNTIDWFRQLDRDRFAPSLIATQPSPNPLLDQVEPYAEEVWVLPDLMPAADMPRFIFDFLRSRDVRVIHLMNSRIGFDLLPDLASLPNPPSVVVQMHAEEVDRSGYVRYVATRYGDLVDRFSMSNRHVADAVEEYGVPAGKVEVIYTGIDPDEEFSPDGAEPAEELPADRLQILFAARLVAQKDPLLMLDVAAAMRERGVAFQIHVVGEGDLEEEMRARIAAENLGEHVLLHPPMPGLRPWYAACDVLLMTSTFEGIPVVVFEAMAMGLPIVTAGLPAIAELLDDQDDGLVLPRDSIAGYVEPLARLTGDREHLAARGRAMRGRARELFSVRQMAVEHGELYERLVASQGRPVEAVPPASPPLPIVAPASAGDPEAALRAGLEAAQGPFVAVTVGSEDSLLAADPAFLEKALRRLATAGEGLDAIALADVGEAGRFAFRALPPDDGPADPVAHTVIWRRRIERDLPQGLHADPQAPAASIAWLLSAAGASVEWRHLPAPGIATPPAAPAPGLASYPPYMGGKSPEADDDAARFEPTAEPALPGAGTYEVPRWELTPTWVPPHSTLATRGEQVVGCLRDSGFQGTAKLIRAEGTYRVLPRERWDEAGEGAVEVGYVELAPLPGMDPLSLAVHRASGEHVLVTHPDDPLLAEVDVVEHLGFVDPFPLKPRQTPRAQRPLGLLGLARSVDQACRRHRYAIGALPEGELVGELGALSESALGGLIPAWTVDGRLVTEGHRPAGSRPGPVAAARWVAEPATWRGLASPAARAKVAARRATIAATRLSRAPQPLAAANGDPEGWLYESERPGRAPLFAAYHPVTGDQLLTRSPEDAAQLGYGKPELLGYIRSIAPLTGDLHLSPLPIPWARRFGAVPRDG